MNELVEFFMTLTLWIIGGGALAVVLALIALGTFTYRDNRRMK